MPPNFRRIADGVCVCYRANPRNRTTRFVAKILGTSDSQIWYTGPYLELPWRFVSPLFALPCASDSRAGIPVAALADNDQTSILQANTAINFETGNLNAGTNDLLWNGTTLAWQGSATAVLLYPDFPEEQYAFITSIQIQLTRGYTKNPITHADNPASVVARSAIQNQRKHGRTLQRAWRRSRPVPHLKPPRPFECRYRAHQRLCPPAIRNAPDRMRRTENLHHCVLNTGPLEVEHRLGA